MGFTLSNTTKIYITMTLTLALMVSELSVGYLFNSNTLVADSFHMFSDAVSFIVSLIAIYSKPKITTKSRKTYGYRRSEQLGAMIHGSLLLGLTFSVGTAAILRFIQPEKVENPKLALIVGSCGLIVDFTGIALFFQSDLKEASMNIRSLFFEKIGDLAGTCVVILTCLLSYLYEDESWVVYIDPAGTLVFCCVLLWATKQIYHMVVRILMQDAPAGFPMDELNNAIEALNDGNVQIIRNNVWQVDNYEIIMSITVESYQGGGKNNDPESQNENDLVSQISAVFDTYAVDFQIKNTTIQVNPVGGKIQVDTEKTLPAVAMFTNDAFEKQ